MVTIFPIRAAAIRAIAHGDHILRIGHLLVEHFDARGHFKCYGSRNNNYIRLARTWAWNNAEAHHVIMRSSGGHHFDRAAGKPEAHLPQTRKARPIEERI